MWIFRKNLKNWITVYIKTVKWQVVIKIIKLATWKCICKCNIKFNRVETEFHVFHALKWQCIFIICLRIEWEHKRNNSPQVLSLSSNPLPQSSSPSQIQCFDIHFCAEQANWFQEQEESRKQTKMFALYAKEKKITRDHLKTDLTVRKSFLQTLLKSIVL